jgi:hypothetical protein
VADDVDDSAVADSAVADSAVVDSAVVDLAVADDDDELAVADVGDDAAVADDDDDSAEADVALADIDDDSAVADDDDDDSAVADVDDDSAVAEDDDGDAAVADDDDNETRPYRYQFGDLTRWACRQVKKKAAKFSGHDTADDYRFGDVTKTILRKLRTGKYRADDVVLALRILATAGMAMAPPSVTDELPVELLQQLVGAEHLAKDVAVRITKPCTPGRKQALPAKKNKKNDLAK